MEEAFRAILLAAAGVTAIAGQRVSFGSNPQGATGPYIVMWTIGDRQGLTITGPDGVSHGRVQVDCYADSYGTAKALARACLAALSGYSGGNFQGIFHASTRDTREGGGNEAERPFLTSMDFLTVYNQS